MSEEEKVTEASKAAEEKPTKNSVAKEIWEWVYTLAIAIIIALLIKGFIFVRYN